ncbi:unnamed protein product [Linum trigynum]|uniref:K Homology domain-containing protein n=1 Tax=Linum trigynum TaxID=586398 RepID=A0AAV2EX04_9ROSI
MADESQSHYSTADTGTATVTPNKRKYDDQLTTGRRHTGFSSPDSSAPPPSYNNVPPPADEIQMAKQKAQEIAARFLSAAAGGAPVDNKRPRVENGGSGFDSNEKGFSSAPSSVPASYGSFMGGTSKRIEIPNGRVGVIIGKSGETIKFLQAKSGAKIQVTRDLDADPNSPTRAVELVGTPEQIETAERLINDVLAEADAGGSGTVSRRQGGQGGGGGGDHFVMKIPNNKVGLVIGKGGETIKSMQARTGARIQVIPLHLPPGDTTSDRNVHIDGTSDQVEAAKQLVNEVISENRMRNSSMSGGYAQQGYQTRPPANWGPPGGAAQQPGYGGYGQPYAGASGQYNMPQPPYGGYTTQPSSGGYPAGWDQSTQPTSQGYDYYSQPPSSQQPPASGGPPPPAAAAAAAENSGGYGYNSQQPHSGYNQQGQGYGQDGYGGYPQSGYGQPQAYDQQQQQQGGYTTAPSYGQEGHSSSYGGGQGESAPQPSSAVQQQGYGSVPNPASYNPPQGATSQSGGYVMPQPSGYGSHHLTAQPGYGSSYGPPPAQKPQVANPLSAYGQTAQQQQSPSGGGSYSQSVPQPGGYPNSQPPLPPPAQSSGYGSAVAAQPGYGPSYGAPLAPSQPGYGPPYGAPYSSQQPGGYPTDGNLSSTAGVATAAAVSAPPPGPPSQPVQQSGIAKASPKS